MHRIIHEDYPFENILYFNFEDERLKPYTVELLNDVVETFLLCGHRLNKTEPFSSLQRRGLICF